MNNMKAKQIIYLSVFTISMLSCKEEKSKYDASGSFEAVETIIASEAPGKILQFNIQEGQQLDSGQLIGFIDSTQLHLNKMQLLQNRKAILSGRPETEVQVESLKKELANSIIDRDRTENLVKSGVAAQQQLDDANAKIAILNANIKAH